jgi:hypothetical protein
LTDSTYDNIHATNAATARQYNDNLSIAEFVAREANAALIGANVANTNDGKIASPFLSLFQAKFFVDSSNSR